MKKLILLVSVALMAFCPITNKAQSFSYQFYKDANNNCTYDATDTLVYNTFGYVQLNYQSLSATTSTSFGGYCPNYINVNSPYLPATNSVTINSVGVNPYPWFSINPTCLVSYSNVPYSGTAYLPLSTIKSFYNYSIYGNSFGSIKDTSNHIFNVCYSNKNDSLWFDFQLLNAYSCSGTVSPVTFSTYVNGVIFDQITTLNGWGFGSKTEVSSYMSNKNGQVLYKAMLSSAVTSPGTYSVVIKSTPIYSLVSVNYSCTINFTNCITGMKDDLDNSQFYIAPNPTENMLIVTGAKQNQLLQLFNSFGTIVYTTNVSNDKMEIDISKETAGIYYLKIGTVTKKIVRQ